VPFRVCRCESAVLLSFSFCGTAVVLEATIGTEAGRDQSPVRCYSSERGRAPHLAGFASSAAPFAVWEAVMKTAAQGQH